MAEEIKTVDPDMDDLDKAIADKSGPKAVDDSKVKISESGDIPVESKESVTTGEPSSRRYAGKYDSVEALETAYQEAQTAIGKTNDELEKARSNLGDSKALALSLDKLDEAMATSDDPVLRKALYEAKKAQGTFAIDPSKVEGPLALEITRAVGSEMSEVRQELSEIRESLARKVAVEYAAEVEKEYPFAATLKEKGRILEEQFEKGEINADKLRLEYAKLGFEAGKVAQNVTSDAAAEAGSDTASTSGQIVSEKTDKRTDEEKEVDEAFEIGMKGPVTFSK